MPYSIFLAHSQGPAVRGYPFPGCKHWFSWLGLISVAVFVFVAGGESAAERDGGARGVRDQRREHRARLQLYSENSGGESAAGDGQTTRHREYRRSRQSTVRY